MRLAPRRLGKAHPTFLVLLLLVVIAARVSADPAAVTTDAQTTDDPSTTDSTPSVTDTTSSTSSTSTSESTTTSSSTSESTTSTTMTSTTTTSSTSSTTSDSSTTSSVSTTTASTSTSTSSSTTSTGAAIVTIPPSAGAPYMQTSNTPEGTVFIAVGAILGFIGLAVLAWRGMVAWSVNRSVRRAAMAQSAESKRLLRGSRKKRSTAVYSAAPAMDVSLDKLGTATRASYKPSQRVPSNSSALFYSPTAGGGGGSHPSINTPAGNRNSSYLPAGFYAAAGSSTPVRDSVNPGYPPSSPSLPPTGGYHDTPHNARHSYAGASTSSLNLNQAPGGRAPSAYLEDLFESHTSPRDTDSSRR
ncbi:hypothetical protein N7520_009415 [Penicillium odoratum]|uniref:uncharacterized protein n=1 Tax=Penicillium odoratum TaxID=1167516 RepID=UPI002548FB29|nr:uncharacterized protein N7520_009415 [Penicillium odoratum]KAJ5752498.1 hypothetical protein N7520_009415 [Penicillium odoratum]